MIQSFSVRQKGFMKSRANENGENVRSEKEASTWISKVSDTINKEYQINQLQLEKIIIENNEIKHHL